MGGGGGGKRAKKSPKLQKIMSAVHCMILFMEHISEVIVRGVKGQKIVQNYKNSLLHSLSQEPYII